MNVLDIFDVPLGSQRGTHEYIWETLLDRDIISVEKELGDNGNMVFIGHGLKRLEKLCKIDRDVHTSNREDKIC